MRVARDRGPCAAGDDLEEVLVRIII